MPDHELIDKTFYRAAIKAETHYLNASLELLAKEVYTLFGYGRK